MGSGSFDIIKYQQSTIGDTSEWQRFVRKYEIKKLLGGFEKDHFDKALELGCGSGKHSKHLAHFCKKLIALEFNEVSLIDQSNDKVTFVLGDAQDLSRFNDAEFDLVFSSNLLEHLSDLDRCLSECARVIRENGLIIHTVPNRMWKVFFLLLYYPNLIKTVFSHVLLKRKLDRANDFKISKPKLDLNLKPLENRPSLRKLLLPKPHGISCSHYREFRNWAQSWWIKNFEKNGLEVVDTVRLPFYFGLGYNFQILLRIGNYLGLSASTGYIIKKAI